MRTVARLTGALALGTRPGLAHRHDRLAADQIGERHRSPTGADAPVAQAQILGCGVHPERQFAEDILARQHHRRTRAARAERSARAGARRQVAIAEPHGHVRHRQPQHLARGLREDGVRPRTDVRHVALDRRAAVGFQPHARLRLDREVAAQARCHADPDQPLALAHRPRRGHLGRPTKPLGALGVAIEHPPGGERLAAHRIGLGLVAPPQFDRVDPELLGQFIHRALDPERADRLARRAHRARLGQVDAHEPGLEPPRVAPVQRQSPERHRLEKLAIVVLRNDALMPHAEDHAVLVGGDADTLRRVRAVVDHVRGLSAGQRDLHRPPDDLRRDRGQDRLRADAGLAAEPAADIRGKRAHLVGIDLERLGDRPTRAADHLVAGADGEPVAVPPRGGRVRLQRGGEMHRRLVGPVECHRCLRHHRVQIAVIDGWQEADLRRGIDRLRVDVEPVLAGFGADHDQRGGIARDRLILRDDDRDRLAEVEDDVGVQLRHRPRIGLAGGYARIVVDDGDDARQRLGRADVDVEDAPAAYGRADDRGIGDALGRAFIRIVRHACDLRRSLDPIQPEPENALFRAIKTSRSKRRIHHVFVHSSVLGVEGRIWGGRGLLAIQTAPPARKKTPATLSVSPRRRGSRFAGDNAIGSWAPAFAGELGGGGSA